MGENIKLSIIIPIFNMEQYLPCCFESIVKQGWNEHYVEIICVDDGSTDNSLSICRKYEEQYQYIKVFSKVNGGVSTARNFGLSKATGDYIYWIDPDDYIDDKFYITIRDILEQNYDAVFFDFITVFSSGKKIRSEYGSNSSEIDHDTYVIDACDGMCNTRPLCIKIVKRRYWQEVGFPEDISYSEDYKAWTYLLIKLRKIYYINEVLYYYRMQSNSICHNVSMDDIMTAFRLAKERCDFIEQNNYNISHIGEAATACMLLQEMINFSIREGKEDSNFLVNYSILLGVLKKYKWQLLFSNKFPIKSKVRMILLVTNLSQCLKWIKRFLDYIRN